MPAAGFRAWASGRLPAAGPGHHAGCRARGRFLAPLLAAISLLAGGCSRSDRSPEISASLAAAGMLSGSAEGYERALAPRDFEFPRDHGAHPGFRTEWWYFTGNLESVEEGESVEGGKRFGFQLTFFRNQLTPRPAERASAWGASEVYMAHFTVTDVAGKRFHAFERFSRAALGLAGAEATPFRVWLGNWQAAGSAEGPPPFRLTAAQDGVAIDLELSSGKPLVLHGERGLSRKGGEAGNASYYYSFPRLPARGTVEVEGDTYRVTGLAWMDREWSTNALAADQIGWDWFSLQLADGRDLMVFRLRRKDGSADPASAGTLIEADGSYRAIDFSGVVLEALDHWTSPASGIRYPSRWRLGLPAEGLELTLTPLLAGQELDVTFRYWEGAVEIVGTSFGQAASGYGYVEMTGYQGPDPP